MATSIDKVLSNFLDKITALWTSSRLFSQTLHKDELPSLGFHFLPLSDYYIAERVNDTFSWRICQPSQARVFIMDRIFHGRGSDISFLGKTLSLHMQFFHNLQCFFQYTISGLVIDIFNVIEHNTTYPLSENSLTVGKLWQYACCPSHLTLLL